MELLEEMEKARKKYHRKIDKAQYHNEIITAASEYIGTLEHLVEKVAEWKPPIVREKEDEQCAL